MKNAIIIHGMPSREDYFSASTDSESNCHWLPWLQKELINRGILTQTPEMPEPYEPVYEKWCSVFEKFQIDEETIIIGHSCGAGFLIRWLSENKVNVGKVVLVAPWTDPDKELDTGMFDFVIDPDLVSRTQGTNVMYSLDDEESVIKTVNELKVAFPTVIFKEYLDKGHFTLEDIGTKEFLEILEVLNLT